MKSSFHVCCVARAPTNILNLKIQRYASIKPKIVFRFGERICVVDQSMGFRANDGLPHFFIAFSLRCININVPRGIRNLLPNTNAPVNSASAPAWCVAARCVGTR